MTKYIVTGGAGFIGSHLVDRLLSWEDAEVVVVDNLSTGFKYNLSEHPKLSFVKADISDWASLSRISHYLVGAKGVFHLAASARVQPSIKEPLVTNNNNVVGTLNVLEMMKLCKISSIVYAGSSSCYGIEPELPCNENQTIECKTPYSLSKYMGEQYCKLWGELYGLKNVTLRYFNVYGRRTPLLGDHTPVVGRLLRQAFLGEDLTVVGDGSQIRNFTHVGNVVEANILAMKKLNSRSYSTIMGKPINIGSSESISIKNLALLIIEEVCRPHVDIEYISERINESHEIAANNSLAKRVLRWEPTTSLIVGLRDLIMYYKNNFEALKQGAC